MQQLTLNVEKGGQKTKIMIQFARSKLLTFERIEDFIRNTMGDDAKILNPEMLRKRLERAKGGTK